MATRADSWIFKWCFDFKGWQPKRMGPRGSKDLFPLLFPSHRPDPHHGLDPPRDMVENQN